jgi:hypothetical protein
VYLHQELCSLLRRAWIQSNSGLPRGAEVRRVRVRRGVGLVVSMADQLEKLGDLAIRTVAKFN